VIWVIRLLCVEPGPNYGDVVYANHGSGRYRARTEADALETLERAFHATSIPYYIGWVEKE
jgi:hypothetical protein